MSYKQQLDDLKVELFWVYMNILYDFGNWDKDRVYYRTLQMREDVLIAIRKDKLNEKVKE